MPRVNVAFFFALFPSHSFWVRKPHRAKFHHRPQDHVFIVLIGDEADCRDALRSSGVHS